MTNKANERWTSDELADREADLLAVCRADGMGRRAIAARVEELTSRTCTPDVAMMALRRLGLWTTRPEGMPNPMPVTDVKPPRDGEVPIEELLSARCEQYQRKVKRADVHARKFELPCRPFALLCMGDPHMDNTGTNIPLLMRHVKMAQSVPDVLGINVGDVTDNWIGRLQRLYADAECTAKDGWRLSKWLLEQIDWLAVVGGNHDAWGHGPGTDPLGWISDEASVKAYASDEVHLELSWKGRPELEPLKILVRHDFAGRSWFNAAHGPGKEAMLDPEIHVALCGHTHTFTELTTEQRRGRVTHAIRLRGYKHEDAHARKLGFFSQQNGSSCVLVVDPECQDAGRVTRFWSVEKGIGYLRMLQGDA